ncbi:hypothetical protein [Phaffia rhodozyma]|uniref:Uncharacterized protein n=1 Tax=Phaffia rhodozyma TaxID=264483 RepID=A0A0F7SGU0_PHARH|nr:hypothetical protein [Phaffia rhodozyma]
MPNASDRDQDPEADLFRRFAALKNVGSLGALMDSSVSADSRTLPTVNSEDDGVDDLDDEVEAYLAAFSQDHTSGDLDISVSESKPVIIDATEVPESLEKETRRVLRDAQLWISESSKGDEEDSNDGDEDVDDGLDEDAIVSKAKDEVTIERDLIPLGTSSSRSPLPDDAQPSSLDETADIGREQSSLSLTNILASLSSPTILPPPPATSPLSTLLDPTLSTAFSRLLALQPSSAPPTDPKKKSLETPSLKPSGSQPKPFDLEGWRAARDSEVDSWCCICSADASLHSFFKYITS